MYRAAISSLACLALLASAPELPAAGGEPSVGVARGRSWDIDRSSFRPPPLDTTHILVEDFDFGPSCSDNGWTVVDLTAGAGDFGVYGALFQGLTVVQEDLCFANVSCLWGFFDGSADDYACGGYPSQPAVPHGGIHNEIQSPPHALAGSGSRIEASLLVYRDLDLDGLVFYTLRVRSYFADVGGPWRDRGVRYYGPVGGGTDWHPAWYRTVIPIGDLVEPGATGIAIAIGVVDMAAQWQGTLGSSVCHSHAPLVDKVHLYSLREYGPQWFVDPADLFQDAFPADGTDDGTVRVDIARDIQPRDVAAIRPGDSLVVSVSEPTVGLAYHESGVPGSGPAVYLHVRDVDPGKSGAVISGDASRWPVTSTGDGWTVLRMDSVRDEGGVPFSPRRFCVDLDDALYTPGEVIEFFCSARDANGRTTYWSEFTLATDALNTVLSYPMEMACLPTAHAGGPSVLYVDGADGTGAQPYFDIAFQQLGIDDWVDRYDIRASDGLLGNGPGSRAVDVTHQVVPYYDIVIWNTGELAYGGFGDGAGRPDKSPDAQFLLEFLRINESPGGAYLSGNDIGERLVRGNGAVLLAPFIDFRLVADSYYSYGMGISPYVTGVPCTIFDHVAKLDTLVAYGGCPLIDDFDVIEPAGAAERVALYESPGNTAGAIVTQATDNDAGWEQRVALSGFSFHLIRDDRLTFELDRTHHLREIIAWIENEIGPPVGPPPPLSLQVVDHGVRLEWETARDRCEDAYRIQLYRLVHTDTVWDTIGPDSLLPANGVFVDTGAVAGVRNFYRYAKHYSGGGQNFSGQASVDLPLDEKRFSARSVARGIELAWSVGSHRTLRGVRPLRAEGAGGTFTPLLGDSLLTSGRGRYVDASVEAGVSYAYRLALVFTNESLALSPVRTQSYTPALALLQNAPNPMGPSTRLPFVLPEDADVVVTIYDVAGRRVATLQSGRRSAGYNEIVWDGRLASGSRAASGVYFYRLQTLGQVLTRKMVVVR
jgi:hypothetical protein